MTARAVLFDLGDTLIFQATQPDASRLFEVMAATVSPLLEAWDIRAGFDTLAFLRDLFGAAEEARTERRAKGLEVDGPFITRGALAAYGVDVSDGQAADLWRATAVDPALWGWQAYPDTVDTLRALRDLPVAVAIVSNGWYTSDVQAPRMAALGIQPDFWDAFVTSADAGKPKPDPAPFRRALIRLGVAPEQALFVGDSLHIDMRGAKRLGMTTVWKLNGRHDAPDVPEVDDAIHDLWELLSLNLLPGRPVAAREESPTPAEDGNLGRY